MGLVHAEIEISNVRNGDLSPIVVASLVDTGALHLCIPEHVAIQLGLDLQGDKREVTLPAAKESCARMLDPYRLRSASEGASWARWFSVMKCCLAPFRWKTWI